MTARPQLPVKKSALRCNPVWVCNKRLPNLHFTEHKRGAAMKQTTQINQAMCERFVLSAHTPQHGITPTQRP